MTTKTFKFIVPQLNNNVIPVRMPAVRCECVEDIMENAARVLFYGAGGWEEAWPLTFHLYTEDGTPVTTAEIFIMSSAPHFDVIIVKSDRTKMSDLYKNSIE